MREKAEAKKLRKEEARKHKEAEAAAAGLGFEDSNHRPDGSVGNAYE